MLGSLYIALTGMAGAAAPDAEPLHGEIPQTFIPRVGSFDYVRRVEMIPMRDGVKLLTVLIVPRAARRAPMLLTRSPYGADAHLAENPTAHVGALLGTDDVADELVASGDYIRVLQDVRGKYGSEGDYVLTRPLVGPLNTTGVDHSTDTYDTIEWLVKNVPESNGKVAILGISYDGFTTLMGLVHPHPALRAAVPINAMVDGWMGDDWFHKGAFRVDSLVYAYDQEATRASTLLWWSDHYDDYDSWLSAGSPGEVARRRGLEQLGFVAKLFQHPAYDAFWQAQAMDKILGAQPLTVPVMLVHSLWDQEDIYGNIAVYKQLAPKDTDHSKLFLVIGPWFHHQQRLDGSAIGAIRFGSDTALYFRRQLLRPFLDHFLKDAAPPLEVAPVNAFETGTNRWLALKSWPSGCISGCRIEQRALYLAPGGGLGFAAPPAAKPGFESYESDPQKPVPYLPRPIHIESGPTAQQQWQTWLVSDQREAASRPDVLSFVSAPLTEPLKVSG
jgi:putative CocE/NonD family hydrolase